MWPKALCWMLRAKTGLFTVFLYRFPGQEVKPKVSG